MLTLFTLSSNCLVQSTFGYLPAFLLQGFQPITPGSALAGSWSHPSVSHRGINCQNKSIFHSTEKGKGDDVNKKEGDPFTLEFEDPEAQKSASKLEHYRTCAKNSIKIRQGWMARGYNCGHIIEDFHKRDLVLNHVHSLHFLCDLEDIGGKLTAEFKGTFKIIEVVSLVAYQLRFLVVYHIQPTINQAYLEVYHP